MRGNRREVVRSLRAVLWGSAAVKILRAKRLLTQKSAFSETIAPGRVAVGKRRRIDRFIVSIV